MKTIIIAAGIALVVGGFVLHYTPSTKVEYKQEVVEKIIEIDSLDARIKAAQDEARAAIEEEARLLYEQSVEQGLLDVELEVRKAHRLELEAIEKEKQKESVSY